jgi:hypothetical protein
MKTKKRTDPWGSPSGSPRSLISNLNTDDPAFDELRADVQRLLEPPPIPTRMRSEWSSPRAYWLRVILNKIQGMGFNQSRRTIVPLSEYHGAGWLPLPSESRNRLRLGEEWFIVADVPIFHRSRQQRKRQMVYWLLDQALKSGEFSQVRRCRTCSEFFASYRRDAQACSPDCNHEYHNQEYQRKGKFMDSYFKRKNQKLKKAKRLKKEGKDIEFIIDKTDLTRLALIRHKIF